MDTDFESEEAEREKADAEGYCSANVADIAVFQDHLADPDAVIERLLPFDVVCVMRERTPLPRNIIERLPNLKLIASTGLETRRSMSPPKPFFLAISSAEKRPASISAAVQLPSRVTVLSRQLNDIFAEHG